jgi:cytochrome P450
MITQPELIQKVLVQHGDLFVNRPEFSTGNNVLDSMLFVARGVQWKRIRVVVTPTLTGHKLRRMRKLIDSCVTSATNRLKAIVQADRVLDLKHYWGLYTVDNISKCFFATDLNLDQADGDQEATGSARSNGKRRQKRGFLHHMKAMVDVPALALLLYMHLPKRVQKCLGLAFFPKESIQYFQQLLCHIVRGRANQGDSYDHDFLQYLIERSELSPKSGDTSNDPSTDTCQATFKPSNDDDAALNSKSGIDLSTVLPRNVRLTEDEVLGQCLIFLIGGYDTTSTLLAWLSYRLALSPHIQQKLYVELTECRRQQGLTVNQPISFETLQSLDYMNAVIYETLRFYPPFTMIERAAGQDFFVPELNLLIPKGMEVGIPLYTLHHMHRHFPLPELFLPERFLSDQYLDDHRAEHDQIDRQLMPPSALQNGMQGAFGRDVWSDSTDPPVFNTTVDLVQDMRLNRLQPYTFLPFGAGPRSCVGKRFALFDIRAVLAQLIPLFRFEPCAQTRYPPRFKTSLSFTHSNDLIVAVKSRN